MNLSLEHLNPNDLLLAPVCLASHFDKTPRENCLSENYMSNGGGCNPQYQSNAPRKPSANRPHESAQASNQSKIEKLNSSGKNFFLGP